MCDSAVAGRSIALAMVVGTFCGCSRGEIKDPTPVDASVIDAKSIDAIPIKPDGPTAKDSRITDAATDVRRVPSKLPGELASGSGISKGGSYMLQSQIGRPVWPARQQSASYSLRHEVALIPW